jgi:hypothetical protein
MRVCIGLKFYADPCTCAIIRLHIGVETKNNQYAGIHVAPHFNEENGSTAFCA